jgi:hypothetical protein
MITQFGYFLYFIGKDYLLWNSVETHGILWFLYYYLETFYWTYLMEVSTSFLIDYEGLEIRQKMFLERSV